MLMCLLPHRVSADRYFRYNMLDVHKNGNVDKKTYQLLFLKNRLLITRLAMNDITMTTIPPTSEISLNSSDAFTLLRVAFPVGKKVSMFRYHAVLPNAKMAIALAQKAHDLALCFLTSKISTAQDIAKVSNAKSR